MIEFCKDYLYAFDSDVVDNKKLYNRCHEIENILKTSYPNTEAGWYGTFSSANHDKYNLFGFPDVQLSKLYQLMVKNISPLLENESYVIKSWMNLYRAGQKVDWHGHWPERFRVWHGFYCVNVGESATHYRIPKIKDTIVVPSKEGRLVIGKSAGDTHASTEWSDTSTNRITLAFDIIPISTLLPHDDKRFDHFYPFKIV
ncbi:MAG: hypothetical protein ACKVIX_03975 [Sphingomonadales bacterium]